MFSFLNDAYNLTCKTTKDGSFKDGIFSQLVLIGSVLDD